jgi:hypothetical protein
VRKRIHLIGIMLTERKGRKNNRAPRVAVSLSAGALPFAFEGSDSTVVSRAGHLAATCSAFADDPGGTAD